MMAGFPAQGRAMQHNNHIRNWGLPMRINRYVAALAVVTTLGTAAASPASAQTAAPIGQIRSNSALLHIDPALVQGGRARIAKMDAARISVSRGGQQKSPGFHVIGNTYSVGTANQACYIIKTSDGLILIDTTFERTVPWVADNIQSLGFKLSDIRIILGSHSHADHEGGLAWMKEHAPNAKLMIMDTDAPILEKGVSGPPGHEDFGMRPVKVDRVLHDGEKVQLGDVTVIAWKTAGHTPGATTYEWKTTAGGKTYDVVDVGSQQAAEKLIPEGYPGIVDDQILGWSRLLSLRPDVWFGGHTWQHDELTKYAALKAGAQPNPYIDPQGYRELIAARAYDFVQELHRQQAAAAGKSQGGD